MAEPTPGPWFISTEGGAVHQFVIITTEWDDDGDDDGEEIAEVETFEDAHLIAAAPDLLAACEGALDGMDGGAPDAMCHRGIAPMEECHQCARVLAVRAAIAKARGEVQQ